MKTEDSLVFSWEGRHIPFILFLFWTFILDVFIFHFLQFILQVSVPFWMFIYMFVIYIQSFTSVSNSHFMPLFIFLQKHFHGATFSLCMIPSQMPQSRGFLAMMNHSEPFLFYFYFVMFWPNFIMTLPFILSCTYWFFNPHNPGATLYFIFAIFTITCTKFILGDDGNDMVSLPYFAGCLPCAFANSPKWHTSSSSSSSDLLPSSPSPSSWSSLTITSCHTTWPIFAS